MSRWLPSFARMRSIRVGIGGLSLALLLLPATGPGLAQDAGADLPTLRRHALALVNASRRENGLPDLSMGPMLDAAAARHAEDMLARHYYAHTSPEGGTVRDRFMEAGGSRWQLVAENIARCEACRPPRTLEEVERLHEGWMNSPPHRENILARGLERFGYDLVVAPDEGLYAVQTFAGPGMPREIQPGEAVEAIGDKEQVREALRFVNQARTRHGQPELGWSDALAAAARAVLPQLDGRAHRRASSGALYQSVPAASRGQWRRIASLSAQCGGCGTEPTVVDLRAFRDQWLDDPDFADTLLASDLTHLGFAMAANGDGGKTAAVVIGRAR